MQGVPAGRDYAAVQCGLSLILRRGAWAPSKSRARRSESGHDQVPDSRLCLLLFLEQGVRPNRAAETR